MPAAEEARLTNNTSGKQFLFRCIDQLSDKVSQNVLQFPIINQSSDNNILFRFTGQTEEITFSFALFDDGTDVSNGTHTSTVTTIGEQIVYLKDEIFTKDFEDMWTLSQSRYATPTITCVISALDIQNAAGGVSIATGTISFIRGRLAHF